MSQTISALKSVKELTAKEQQVIKGGDGDVIIIGDLTIL